MRYLPDLSVEAPEHTLAYIKSAFKSLFEADHPPLDVAAPVENDDDGVVNMHSWLRRWDRQEGPRREAEARLRSEQQQSTTEGTSHKRCRPSFALLKNL